MDTGLDNANATNNPFTNSNGSDILSQKDGFLLNLSEGFKQNGKENPEFFLETSANGKRSADEFEDDEDLGPETDVDAVDDVLLSPNMGVVKNIISNSISQELKNFNDNEEKTDLDLDENVNLQKLEKDDFDTIAKSAREETPTPPADEGKGLF